MSTLALSSPSAALRSRHSRVAWLGFIGAMGGMMIALNVTYQFGLGFSPLACAVATIGIPVAAIAGSITSSALLPKHARESHS